MQIKAQDVSRLRGLIFKITRISKKLTSDLPFSNTELNIIGLLDRHQQLLPSEIADAEHVSAQAISQNLNNLSKANIISRVTDEKDKRKMLITLSDHGKTQLSEIRSIRDSWLKSAIEKKLNHTEIEALINIIPILEKITNNDIKA